MPCENCVDKLAKKLIGHYPKNLDLLRAYEIAERAVERVENRTGVKPQIVSLGNPSDYSQDCVCGRIVCTSYGDPCDIGGDCLDSGDCGLCSCPTALPNSHVVANKCKEGIPPSPTACQVCRSKKCILLGNYCTNPADSYCTYDCDEGYVWNGSACVSVGIASKRLLVGVGV